MKAGAAIRQQHHNPIHFFVTEEPKNRWDAFLQFIGLREPVVTSCAMGAAMEAAEIERTFISGQGGFPVEWHGFLYVIHKCPSPACPLSSSGLRIVTHLNDYHEWDRVAIANWIATAEEKLEDAAAEKIVDAAEAEFELIEV
jgi:hypothetical protein